MYSPKIDESLIRPLYFYSKYLEQPMTRTVNQLLYESLSRRDLPKEAQELILRIPVTRLHIRP